MVLEFDGLSPGHDSFEKVINLFHIWLHFVLLS